MYIKSLSLENYRNFERFTYTFDQHGCLISGENGSGKSNLLEAIAYSAYGKSVRHHNDSDIVRFGVNHFFFQAGFVNHDEAYSFDIGYENNRKVIKLNGAILSRMSELYKHIKVVYFSPDDISLVNGTPRLRRSFIDTAIANTDWEYLYKLKEYNQILQQRNALLKSDFEEKHKQTWDTNFCTASITIVKKRLEFIRKFEKVFNRIYSEITDKEEEITFNYKATLQTNLSQRDLEDFLFTKEQREKEVEHSLFGPHLDELIIKINGKPARDFASQGQKRSIVIALKLAQAELIRLISDEYPILMFDDILSELDNERTRNIIHNISKEHQIFIATPNADHYKDFDLRHLELKNENIDEV